MELKDKTDEVHLLNDTLASEQKKSRELQWALEKEKAKQGRSEERDKEELEVLFSVSLNVRRRETLLFLQCPPYTLHLAELIVYYVSSILMMLSKVLREIANGMILFFFFFTQGCIDSSAAACV